jgi:hypothetical protein
LNFTNKDNMSWAWTVSVRALTTDSINQWFLSQSSSSWTNRALHLWYSTEGRWLVFALYSNDADTQSTQRANWQWHNYTFTWNWSTWYNIYVDWTSVKSWTLSSWFYSSNNSAQIWWWQIFWSTQNEFKWYMSEFFIETWQWSASQVLEYYNKTKRNYWK